MAASEHPRIEIVDLETSEVVHIIPLPGQVSVRFIGRVIGGVLRNLNRERYVVREVLSDGN